MLFDLHGSTWHVAKMFRDSFSNPPAFGDPDIVVFAAFGLNPIYGWFVVGEFQNTGFVILCGPSCRSF